MIRETEALFTCNVCVCVRVKLKEWVRWKQMIVFTLNVSFFLRTQRQRSKENANTDVTCNSSLRIVEEGAWCQSDSDEVTVLVESESLVTQTVSMETESSTIATAPST